jgi:hypothetical protein
VRRKQSRGQREEGIEQAATTGSKKQAGSREQRAETWEQKSESR